MGNEAIKVERDGFILMALKGQAVTVSECRTLAGRLMEGLEADGYEEFKLPQLPGGDACQAFICVRVCRGGGAFAEPSEAWAHTWARKPLKA